MITESLQKRVEELEARLAKLIDYLENRDVVTDAFSSYEDFERDRACVLPYGWDKK